MKELFAKIADTRSLLVAQMIAEDNIGEAVGEDLDAFRKIIDTNILDEARLVAHERLGNVAEVNELQQWLAGKAARDCKNQAVRASFLNACSL